MLIYFLKNPFYESKSGKIIHKLAIPRYLKYILALTERVDFPGHVVG